MSPQSLPTGTHKKVIVAMSGGVDSSVAAALLKRAGFNVAGVFMKFWHEAGRAENRCCSTESEQRARQVAAKLGIPFYVLNFEEEFKKRIVDYFLREYKRGLTPNPCVVCNKEIKFGLLLEKALALGADYVATGHYVRLRNSRLFRSKDKSKDQSYFLWQLNQNQLRYILFPVGNYTKKEARELAEKFGLPTATTPDSQEICFIPEAINDFLAKYIKQKRGKIVDTKKKILGEHKGLAFYTIGQRKGIRLPGGPYWVLDKELTRNVLVITKNEKDLLKRNLFCRDVNWIAAKEPKLPLKVKAKIRYRAKLASATISKLKAGRYKLVFVCPQRAITAGQSVVFYSPAEASAKEGRGQELLGGGIISYLISQVGSKI